MLMRTDPFREFEDMLRQADRQVRSIGMPMDAYRRDDEFVVDLDLPGVDEDSIDVTVERDMLQISARRTARHTEGDQVLVAERPQGSVTRQLFLGQGLDTDRIEATYDDGVLTVVIPVAEQAKPRQIKIGGGSGAKAVNAGASAS